MNSSLITRSAAVLGWQKVFLLVPENALCLCGSWGQKVFALTSYFRTHWNTWRSRRCLRSVRPAQRTRTRWCGHVSRINTDTTTASSTSSNKSGGNNISFIHEPVVRTRKFVFSNASVQVTSSSTDWRDLWVKTRGLARLARDDFQPEPEHLGTHLLHVTSENLKTCSHKVPSYTWKKKTRMLEPKTFWTWGISFSTDEFGPSSNSSETPLCETFWGVNGKTTFCYFAAFEKGAK